MAIKFSAIATKACLGYLACSTVGVYANFYKFDKMLNVDTTQEKERSFSASSKAKDYALSLQEAQQRIHEILRSADIRRCIPIFSALSPIMLADHNDAKNSTSARNNNQNPALLNKLRFYFTDEINMKIFKLFPKPLSSALLFLNEKFDSDKDLSSTSLDADTRVVLEALFDFLRETQVLTRREQLLKLLPQFTTQCKNFNVTHEFALWTAPIRVELLTIAASNRFDDAKQQKKYIRKKFIDIAHKYSTDKNFYLPPEYMFVKQILWILDITLLSAQEDIYKQAKELYDAFARLLVSVSSESANDQPSYSKDNQKSSQSSYQNQGRQVAKQAFGLLQSIF